MVLHEGFGEFLARASVHRHSPRVVKLNRQQKRQLTLHNKKSNIVLAERIIIKVRKVCGDDFADVMLAGSWFRMPHKFWENFVVDDLGLSYCTQQRNRCYRAMREYIDNWVCGKRTLAAMLDGASPKSKRKKVCIIGICFYTQGPWTNMSRSQAGLVLVPVPVPVHVFINTCIMNLLIRSQHISRTQHHKKTTYLYLYMYYL